MTGVRLVYVYFLCAYSLKWCQGITNLHEDQKNLIGEEERRGANIKNIKKDIKSEDQKKVATTNRGLWIIGQPNRHPYTTGYDSTGVGEQYHGYPSGGEGGYGISSSGYDFDTTGPDSGGYYKKPQYGSGYGHGVSGYGFGHSASGSGYGHNTEVVYEPSAEGHHGSGYHGSGHHGSGHHGSEHHGSEHSAIQQKLALKKILIPLAGLALLGAAAALSTNPVLLQLGTISGKGRRRRSIMKRSGVYPAYPMIRPEFLK